MIPTFIDGILEMLELAPGVPLWLHGQVKGRSEPAENPHSRAKIRTFYGFGDLRGG
jgi:hypothetical protein